MRKRIRKLAFKLWRSKGVDIIVTHAPPAGYGDGSDYAHRGWECLLPLLDQYKPRYWAYGHVHMSYGANIPRLQQHGDTTLINAWERYILDVE